MTQTGLKRGLAGVAAVIAATLVVVGGLAGSGKAGADVTSGRCDPTERQEREFPRSSQSPGYGFDRDPDTPGIQCNDALFDMDGPARRSAPAAPRPAAAPKTEQAVGVSSVVSSGDGGDGAVSAEAPTATPDPTAEAPETGESSNAPRPPGPRVWWNGVFMDMDEFLCFQERATNPFVDTLESTGCAN